MPDGYGAHDVAWNATNKATGLQFMKLGIMNGRFGPSECTRLADGMLRLQHLQKAHQAERVPLTVGEEVGSE